MPTLESANAQFEPTFVDLLLQEQQQFTAVEKFTQWHTESDEHTQGQYYQNLLPTQRPGSGEQYAFEVDLDQCSGCMACVTACHNLNGLEDEEVWRNVGLLFGGTSQLPVVQHITSTCHHCIEPACLDGCPVEAYEKDPVTGIVSHLDDQCIGCKYCIWKCPYDVPRYSKSKGIVRKCDMCKDRLLQDEAPACVQSCPNQAIKITTVNQQNVIEESELNLFVPGAPDPGYTLPTTVYRSKQPLPRNLLPADYYSARPQQVHLSLVFMLVLTQMSVGAFAIEQYLASTIGWFQSEIFSGVRVLHLITSLILGVTGLIAAIFHLGRPWLAYRALIGLRRSWLSREILAFNLFAVSATLYATTAYFSYLGYSTLESTSSNLGLLSVGLGVIALFCSAMIYIDTRRPFWNGSYTLIKFFFTAAILGIPTALLVSLVAPLFSSLSINQVMGEFGFQLCKILMAISLSKLTFECLIFTHLREKQHTPLKRTALLLQGELALCTIKRFFFGMMGGVFLPGLLVVQYQFSSLTEVNPIFVSLILILSLVSLFIGELLERYLFFAASVAQKMPGAP